MKKILLLLIGLTIISCSSDDEATDPFIGTWYATKIDRGIESSSTLAINSNGTFTVVFESDDGLDEDDSSGEWSNSGSDFTSFSQIYTLKFNDEDNDIITVIFSEDFNSWASDSGKTWTRR
tara:strand:- start:152 stop:514 length:363 start_codon:yes stop_codon:yes gene_type:complete